VEPIGCRSFASRIYEAVAISAREILALTTLSTARSSLSADRIEVRRATF
jgi:hypothetical protein